MHRIELYQSQTIDAEVEQLAKSKLLAGAEQ